MSDTWSFVPTITASNGERGISINLAEFDIGYDSELFHIPCQTVVEWNISKVDEILTKATLHALECPHHKPTGFFSNHGALDIGIISKETS